MISLPPLALPDLAAIQILLRRLAAIFYDSLLVTAVLFAASLPVVVFHGDAIAGGAIGYRLYLLAIIGLYFSWQWTHGGQTLGMKAWRLHAVTGNNQALDWRQSLARCLVAMVSIAALGLGYLWLLIDRDRLTWHDRLSGTQLIYVKDNW